MFRNHTVMANEVAAGIETGELKTAADVVHALEKHVGSLEGRIPLTKTVIFLEDSPARYLRIKKGNPNVGSRSPADLPHRKDIKYPRRIEGDLHTIFSEMNGIDHPRIVVETKNRKGYEIVFDPDDKQAMEIVAKQLGMTVGEDDREVSRPANHRRQGWASSKAGAKTRQAAVGMLRDGGWRVASSWREHGGTGVVLAIPSSQPGS